MSLGSWEIIIPQTFKEDRSTSEVLYLPALSHSCEYTEVSCSLWPPQADVAWYYWSLGLLSFAVNLFCCLWKRAKQNCCYYLIELKCSVLVSFHLLFTGIGTGRGTLYTWCFLSHFQPPNYLCVFVRPGKLRAVLQDLQSTREMQVAVTAELLCAHAHGSSGILQ